MAKTMTQELEDKVLRRMLSTPPEPHKPKPEKTKSKAPRKPATPKKKPA